MIDLYELESRRQLQPGNPVSVRMTTWAGGFVDGRADIRAVWEPGWIRAIDDTSVTIFIACTGELRALPLDSDGWRPGRGT